MRAVYAIPVLVFAALAVALGVGLTLKPRVIPSALIGVPVPQFDLAPLYEDGRGLSGRDLADGEIKLVNFFASWCAPCRVEHDLLMRLAREEGMTIYGINYKDARQDAHRFLDRLGNPYSRIGVDRDGRVGIDWGVYGLPETYVIGPDGRILVKHVGPLFPDIVEEKFRPVMRRARQAAS